MNMAADGSSSAAPVVTPGPSAERKRRSRLIPVRSVTGLISVSGSETGIGRSDGALFRERTRQVKQLCVERFLFSDDVGERRRGDLSPLHPDQNSSFAGQ